ncbi:MAG: transcriptional repressor [Prevotellaceae bacterium]|nr:transcriptional repressor [Prevotellaceae bacterium]
MPHNAPLSDEQSLLNAGVRLTALRLMVWHHIRTTLHDTFSLADLEAALPTVDRSTLFRTLGTLTAAHLLHEINDGTGIQKYCVCPHSDTRHCGGHVHLTCRLCHRTICLTNVSIPTVPLPQGFQAEEAEYIVKGICADCASVLK